MFSCNFRPLYYLKPKYKHQNVWVNYTWQMPWFLGLYLAFSCDNSNKGKDLNTRHIITFHCTQKRQFTLSCKYNFLKPCFPECFSFDTVHILLQVAQAHYESPQQHFPTQLINYSYNKKIIRRCMEKCSLLTKLAKCTLNIALKLTFSVFLFFFVF